jgi:hypothetical protein
MSYDLAIMALEGMSRAPLVVRTAGGEIVIEGAPASFKELARLCLLLGGGHIEDEFELQPGVHITADSQRVRLRTENHDS